MSGNGKKKKAGVSRKRDLFYETCEHLFTVEQKTIPEVAEEFKGQLSEQTIRNWSAEGGWVEKRRKTITAKEAFDIKLYRAGMAIMDSIEKDEKAGKEIAPSRYYTLCRIIEVLPKAKKAEMELRKPGTGAKSKINSLDNLMKVIDKSLKGEV